MMAATGSTMMELGTDAPAFSLADTDGNRVSPADFAGQPLLVMFICNHCPFVKHVAPVLARIGRDYQDRGVGVVAIMSNDVDHYPEDSPRKMAQEKEDQGFAFAYLYDKSQEVAKAYTAACTPDVFLFDADHKLFYRGQIDQTRPRRISSGNYSSDNPATGQALEAALDAVLSGQEPPTDQHPSMGCNIKWKPGNEPAYA